MLRPCFCREFSMELLQEIIVTALLSFLFAFLLSKFVSTTSAANTGRNPQSPPDSFCSDDFTSNDRLEQVVSEVDLGVKESIREGNGADMGEVRIEKMEDGEFDRELVIQGLEDVKISEFGGESLKVGGFYRESVKDPLELVKVDVFDRVLVKEGPEMVKVLEFDSVSVEEGLERVKNEGFDKKTVEGKPEQVKVWEFNPALVREVAELDEACELGNVLVTDEANEVKVARSKGKSVNEVEQVDRYGAECDLPAEGKGERFSEVENVNSKDGSFTDDDDWEGIERSEVGKLFAVAAAFVASGSSDFLSKIRRDVQMKMYGLHKVAMEGPCCEPQPSALKVSSRAKWHAWQQLGNMNPEVAMEQYISLLSDLVPGWTGEKSGDDVEGEGDSNSPVPGILGTKASDPSSFLRHQLAKQNERKLEDIHECDKGDDAVGVLKFIEQGMPVDSLDFQGRSAIHMAVISGKLDTIKLLVSLGGDINTKDIQGQTPLHHAAKCNRYNIARYLIEQGADVTAKDSNGHTPGDIYPKGWGPLS